MTVLAPWLGTAQASRAEIDRLALRALDETRHALIDLSKVLDLDFAKRIHAECERQHGRAG